MKSVLRIAGMCLLLLLSVVLLGIGALRRRDVFDPESAKRGIELCDPISDRQMTIDATFSGVERRDGRLYSTYDRTVKRAKRACPT